VEPRRRAGRQRLLRGRLGLTLGLIGLGAAALQYQGGWYADSRVNVGEPYQPINGSGFIQGGEVYDKLSVPLW
jgi:hypothetical protein